MAVDRSGLPRVGPDPAFVFPAIQRHALDGGLNVWTVEHRGVPMVTWLLLVPAGAAADPDRLPGLAALTGDLLDEGAGDRDALELSDALARTGSQLDTEVDPDATVVGLTSLTRCCERALPFLADIAVRPRFEPAELVRIRDLRLSRLRQLGNLPPALADRAFTETLYPNHPYGHLSIGTALALENVALGDVRAFHSRYYQASTAILIGVGDAPHAQLVDWAAAAFQGWSTMEVDTASFIEAPGAPRSGDGGRAVFVSRPAAAQSELRVGHVAAARDTPDYHALLILNMVLGGQFVSRLNMKLREEKGFTYGVRSAFDFRRGPGPFVVQVSVQSNATGEALGDIMAEISDIRGPRSATDDEVQLASAALTRGYPRGFQSAEQIARAAAKIALHGLPDDYFSQFIPRTTAVDARRVTDVADRYLHPDSLSAVVVGDRAAAEAAFGRVGLGTIHEPPLDQ